MKSLLRAKLKSRTSNNLPWWQLLVLSKISGRQNFNLAVYKTGQDQRIFILKVYTRLCTNQCIRTGEAQECHYEQLDASHYISGQTEKRLHSPTSSTYGKTKSRPKSFKSSREPTRINSVISVEEAEQSWSASPEESRKGQVVSLQVSKRTRRRRIQLFRLQSSTKSFYSYRHNYRFLKSVMYQ